MNQMLKFLIVHAINIFVFIFLIFSFPIKPIFEFFFYKNPDFFRGPNNPAKHKEKVKLIQAQIQEWIQSGKEGYLSTSRPSWKQLTARNTDILKKSFNHIKVELGDIVEIDTKNKILTVEPRMGMGTLTYKLLALGWTIPVVPEFEELTIGGLICGAGLETSSHKYGLFSNTCIEYEVVLPNGKVVTCSNTENKDLFDAIPMSYGTLGFLTAIKFPILPAKKYVELKYYSATTLEAALKLLSVTSHEFVEGFQYAKNKFVITYGDFADSAPKKKVKTFLGWHDQFFYLDTEGFFGKLPGSDSQFIPLRDYYHRHTRGIFWLISEYAPIFRYTRYIFGWLLPLRVPMIKFFADKFTPFDPSSSLLLFQNIGVFCQDYVVPINSTPKLMNIIESELEIYPIWFCPTKVFAARGMIQPLSKKDSLYLDIGVYGTSKKSFTFAKVAEIWSQLEHETLCLGGFIGFYTDNFVTREDFHQMFNHNLYWEVRKKYGCEEAYPLPYEKVQNPKVQKKSKLK